MDVPERGLPTTKMGVTGQELSSAYCLLGISIKMPVYVPVKRLKQGYPTGNLILIKAAIVASGMAGVNIVGIVRQPG